MHRTAGTEFHQIAKTARWLKCVSDVDAIENRLAKHPYRRRDMEDYLEARKALMAAGSAHVSTDVRWEGKGVDRSLRMTELQFAAAGDEKWHLFMAATATMRRLGISKSIRPMPLCVFDHVGESMLDRGLGGLTYGSDFVYELGTALLLQHVLHLPEVNPKARENVAMPYPHEKRGLYLGELQPYSRTDLNREHRHSSCTVKNRFFKRENTLMPEAEDLPISEIHLYTAVSGRQFADFQAALCRRMRDLLDPAFKSGLLAEICHEYAHGKNPLESARPEIRRLVETMTGIVNSAEWEANVDRLHSRNAASPKHAAAITRAKAAFETPQSVQAPSLPPPLAAAAPASNVPHCLLLQAR